VSLRDLALDLAPLKESPGYRRLFVGDTVSTLGTQVTTVAVPLQVYDLTRSSASVGLVGLAGLLPLVVLGLYGGAVADAFERRALLAAVTVGQLLLSVVLLVQAASGFDQTWLLYLVVAFQSGLFAVASPTRQAMLPRLVRRELLPAANALRMAEFNTGLAVGPALAGVLAAGYGYQAAYALDVATFVVALIAIQGLPRMVPEGGGRRAGTASVVEGLRFLRTQDLLLATFVLDLIAMVLAMPRALFPELADEVFGGGERTAGLLYSALAIGGLVGAVSSGWASRVHRHGVAIVWSIVAWGVAISLLGLTPYLWVGLLALAAAGIADGVSAIFRGAVLQAAAPDEMRGRVGGVFIVVVAGGPRLADGRAGASAAVIGPQAAVVVGGVAAIAGTLLVAARYRSVRTYDAREPLHVPVQPRPDPL
jgi:MFS family permease